MSDPLRDGDARGNLVMVQNRARDLGRPRRATDLMKVGGRQVGGRRQVVEGAIGPDAEIVEHRSNRDLLDIERGRRKTATEIQHTVGVMAVSGKVRTRASRCCSSTVSSDGDIRSAWGQRPHFLTRRAVTQLTMSAITASRPRSFSRSWTCPSYSFSVLSADPAVS